MNRNVKNALTIVALGATVALTGCATTAQFDELKAEVNAIKSDISSAKADAAAARAAADNANRVAAEARDIANQANARSIEEETRIDRAFKKSMYK